MKLQAARPGLNLLNETGREACVAFAEKAEIHGKGIGSLEHPPNMPGSWRAGGCSRSRRRPRPTPHHCGEARIKRLLDLLRADEVHVYIDATGRDNVTFASDHLGSRSDDYIDVRLHIWIASLAYGGDTPVLRCEVRLHNSPVIKNQGVGDDGNDRALPSRPFPLTHAA